MGKRSTSEPTVNRHIELYASDWEFLNTNYGRDSPYRHGTGNVIREIVRQKVRALRAKQAQDADDLGGEPTPNV